MLREIAAFVALSWLLLPTSQAAAQGQQAQGSDLPLPGCGGVIQADQPGGVSATVPAAAQSSEEVEAPVWLLAPHIISGIIALVAGVGAMLTRKGSTWHRRWGKAFFWCLFVLSVTAVPLNFYQPDAVLLALMALSFYLALSGYRTLYRKSHQAGQGAMCLDWAAPALLLAASACMIIYGSSNLDMSNGTALSLVVFGIIGWAVSVRDCRTLLNPPTDKRHWFFTHMQRMLLSYVVMVMVFAVLNFKFLPVPARWLLPAVPGLLGTWLWVRYYRQKFQSKDGGEQEPPQNQGA